MRRNRPSSEARHASHKQRDPIPGALFTWPLSPHALLSAEFPIGKPLADWIDGLPRMTLDSSPVKLRVTTTWISSLIPVTQDHSWLVELTRLTENELCTLICCNRIQDLVSIFIHLNKKKINITIYCGKWCGGCYRKRDYITLTVESLMAELRLWRTLW